ncbi:MAG: 1-aminocyclopropane-1-carboxylate deaminase/D-cysteine desulfhydrase [Flavobacterium sp.]|nr:MAG: 1-aminocyclopropane-1-carboxylate deaminase/D-cysteine desulfhydrase [Flavobacterium sp.]
MPVSQEILVSENGVSLTVRREDLIDAEIPGNKFRKLKYNLDQARSQGKKLLLTFGGAYSNHIDAVAAAGKRFGLETVGIIRGEELVEKIVENPTLSRAAANGMRLKFVTRAEYKLKNSKAFLDRLEKEFGEFYLLPEGGTNELAVKGCEEILTGDDAKFDYICCAVGTGGTLAGLINSSKAEQMVLGFPILKADLRADISKWTTRINWELIAGYEFGGYGKVDGRLIQFINGQMKQNSLPLDPIYTGKMLFGVMDLISTGYFREGSMILAIHTGGLQGIEGINRQLQIKNLPIIEINDKENFPAGPCDDRTQLFKQ